MQANQAVHSRIRCIALMCMPVTKTPVWPPSSLHPAQCVVARPAPAHAKLSLPPGAPGSRTPAGLGRPPEPAAASSSRSRMSSRPRWYLSHVAQPLREPARAAAGQVGARPQQPLRSTRGRSRRCCRTRTPASASSVRLAAYSASGLRGARSARSESDAYAPSCLPCAPEHQLADVLFFSIFSHLPLPTICSALLHYIFDQYL